MKICMVTLDNPLHHLKDGIAVSVNELSIALAKLGHEIWVIGFDKSVEREEITKKEGVEYWCLPNKGDALVTRMFYFMREVTKRLEKLDREEKIDVFHGHGGYAGPIASANFSKARKVLTLHTTSEEDFFTLKDLYVSGLYVNFFKKLLLPPIPVLKLYRKWYCNKMDRIISVSKHNVDVVLKDLGLPREKFVVIPNGVNYRKFQKIKSKLNIEKKENTVLYYGRLAPRKGVQILLRSIPLVLEEFPLLKVNIIGDGEYLPVLKRMASELNIEKHVNFKSFLNGEPLVREIVESTMVVIPSLYEGLPLALLESMALGKPVIASKLPGICEVLKDNRTGLLIRPNDPLALSRAIIRVLDPLSDCKNIDKRGEKYVRENLTWSNIAKETIEVYERG